MAGAARAFAGSEIFFSFGRAALRGDERGEGFQLAAANVVFAREFEQRGTNHTSPAFFKDRSGEVNQIILQFKSEQEKSTKKLLAILVRITKLGGIWL